MIPRTRRRAIEPELVVMIVDEVGCGRPIASVEYVVKQKPAEAVSGCPPVRPGRCHLDDGSGIPFKSCTVQGKTHIKSSKPLSLQSFNTPQSRIIPRGHATPCVNPPAGSSDSQVCCAKVSLNL